MALVTNTAIPGADRGTKDFWIATIYSNDVNPSGENLLVKAAPSSGNLYLEHIIIICNATSITVTLKDDETIVLGPWLTTTAQMTGIYDLTFIRPIKFSGAINVRAGADSDINVFAEGYSA